MKEIYPEPEIPVDKIIRVMYLALNEAESIMNDSKMPKYVANTNKFKGQMILIMKQDRVISFVKLMINSIFGNPLIYRFIVQPYGG